MGKYDSSKYRVVPLVEAIKFNQKNFELLLKAIHTQKDIPNLVCPAIDSAYYCGDNEKQLNPTKEHLKGLVKYIADKDFGEISVSNKKRADLYGLNGVDARIKARDEALQLIDEMSNDTIIPKAWYIFEGATNPDIYIEGEDYVIICEGKWTESHITTKTTHLKSEKESRNQMIRHIQGALNSTKKKVYAFYVVDADCGYTHDLDETALASHIKEETIKPLETEKIISAFYGYTTWQELEGKIKGLRFLTKKQIDEINVTIKEK